MILPHNTLVLATRNEGKIREIKVLLHSLQLKILTASDFKCDEPEETGSTFQENASLKAKALAHATGFAALSDDSGLVIPALNGQPGIYSARWAGPEKDFKGAMERIRKALENTTDRRAHFTCAIAIALPTGEIYLAEADAQGSLVFPPRGTKSFGYSPIFVPEGYDQTYGEMDFALKNKISARRKALDQVFETLRV